MLIGMNIEIIVIKFTSIVTSKCILLFSLTIDKDQCQILEPVQNSLVHWIGNLKNNYHHNTYFLLTKNILNYNFLT